MDRHSGGPTCKTVIHDCNSVVHSASFYNHMLAGTHTHTTVTGAMVVPTSPVPQLTRVRGMVPQWSPALGWPTKTWSLCSSTQQVLTPFHSTVMPIPFQIGHPVLFQVECQYLSLSEPLAISPRYLWCRVSDHRGM